MELLLVNHVITGVKAMLTTLVEAEVITDPEARTLLPLLVLHAIKYDTIEIPSP